ncbi:MAG: AzlC family ABC transporter permease [Mobilicoccus sp.]|nr:AzlC family ABC transporter permease [Mobilicoccus sp.]
MSSSFRRGIDLGVPYATVGFLLSLSFAVLARQAGFSVAQTLVTSAIVFAGSAQFAALAIVSAGGTIPAALAAGGLMNARFLAMGIALAPSLRGGPVRRTLTGQAIVDSSWVVSQSKDGQFDVPLMLGSTLPQYLTWFTGSLVGAFAGNIIGDTERFGLDAIFPTFFLALLLAELGDPKRRLAAAIGGVVALALVPFTPPGIPVLAAAVGAIVAAAR